MSIKRLLALALTLVMVLSVGVSAGFSDKDKIDQSLTDEIDLINADLTDDIELVKALGLMTGNPDGSFNPQGTLTRGEADVIIYRLKSGKTDIDASWGDTSLNTFTDMADQ